MATNQLFNLVVAIETMQYEAEDNLDFDLARAEQLTYKVSGKIEMIKEIGLLTGEQMSKLSLRQINLEEKLRNAKEKAEQVGKQAQHITN